MRVCIVGTGYVGLVSAACFAEMGNDVVCVDVNPKVVEKLKNGEVHIYEPGLEKLVQQNFKDGRLVFTTKLTEGLSNSELVFICVGTPSGDDGSCDLSYVEAVAKEIGSQMQKPLVIVDKSTVPVGTADFVRELIAAELKKRKVDIDFDVVSNPEFLKEGDAVQDFMKPDRVIVGTSSEKSASLLKELYAPFARSRDKLIVMSVRSAEMTKYAANCMLATKISFINEIANLCEQVGADVRDVRTGIGADHRIGYHFIYPGLGYGGSCFPKDVKALIHTARKYNFAPELLEAVDNVNNRQKVRMAERIRAYFDKMTKSENSVHGKTLALWGLAFKANTDDMRDAASLSIIQDLTKHGMKIQAFDPVAHNNARNILKNNPLVSIMDNQYDVLKNADALLVVTEWNQFRTPDFKRIKESLKNPLIFDGRNLYSDATLKELGFTYLSVGKA
ncbi:UDP-glucose dehydrogenase family protein [Desulfovibrio litoralis]|uniref:UDP-glucose 6-dehydrogenase n=1 Tax=Desulfovibrio litoralis DSM 11393 TaxID=1121455 RepID=A0A1M7T8Y9_9BACT|nr:UDP-glucose/GDP-mannose dehydrogenase family protein [Desulfovibrio litoralis]SHN67214.1 UDPglucose 6-dehydrogenase [Desulfovibrio litoralis DSM 11393]